MADTLDFHLQGAFCASGIIRVKKALNAVDGVDKISVHLARNLVQVEGRPDPQAVVSALRDEGFDASFGEAATGELPRREPTPRQPIHSSQGDVVMTVNRAVSIFAGFMVMASLALAHFMGQIDLASMSWLWLTFFVGANLFQMGFTGFCPAASIFRALGLRDGSPGGCCTAHRGPSEG